ncbi:MAG TPA: glycolate oxidase subunit GlcE [Rhabdaerophilum sp.]|nr:glycolate oxidase subunit GlcE [Rhabdaerophilum sp.]
MSEARVLRPANEAEAIEAMRDALAGNMPIRIAGGETRGGIGRPVQSAMTVSTAALKGITLYEPSEMVIGARAGTPLAEIEAALAAKGQMLPFEPADYRTIFGSSGEPTIGTVAAGNISGPRRLWAGAARDSLIGVRFVNGSGEIIKSGGRVMKNVTGLDLVKLQAGAWGTLGLLTEVIFKVSPRPETVATLTLAGLDDARAVAAMGRAIGSPFEITGAAHDPAARQTYLRIEGFGDSVRYRAEALGKLLSDHGKLEHLGTGDDIWPAIRDAKPVALPRERALWRLSVRPSLAAGMVAAIRAARACDALYDWGGGLVWLATEATGDAGERMIREAARQAKGHATLMRAPAPVRASVPVFEPEAAPVAALTRRIKAAVDPSGLINPGLMHAGL